MIERILSAFPFTPPPLDQNLVGAELEHLRKCDECREAQEFFTGKAREVILGDEQNFPHLVDAFDLFTPDAWHYYLPVFLIQGILSQQISCYHFWHHNKPWLIEGYWSQRIKRLDYLQCEVILEYLHLGIQYDKASGRITDKEGKILEWWQGIRREKQG